MNLETVTHTARAAMAQDLGKKIDAQKTLLEQELLRTQGAIGALVQAMGHLEKMQDAPNPLEDGSEPTEAQKTLWYWCSSNAHLGLCELKGTAQRNCVVLTSKIAACEASLDVCQASFEAEVRAVRIVEAALAEELAVKKGAKPKLPAKKPRRKAGEHPGPTLKKARNKL